MLTNLNIVKAMNRPKLLERLEELERQLSICEKALSDYLETKKLIYPRFYFISSADLLDILSNGKISPLRYNNNNNINISSSITYTRVSSTGNNPELVSRHLPKLYDSLARLQWKLEGGKPTKHANGMVAKDGEEMAMHGTCDCTGKV